MPGASVTLSYQATPGDDVVTAPGVGSAIDHTNTARSVGTDPSGATANNAGPYGSDDATASTRIDRVDISIAKENAVEPIAGADFDWTITVTNDGPTDTAIGAFTVTDTLPTTTGVDLVSASGTGWVCDPATGPTAETEVECTRVAASDSLAPGASLEPITMTFSVDPDLADGTVISNTADVTIDGTYEDPTDLDNNEVTDTATVQTQADLEIVKTLVDPPGLVAGAEATYELEITNLGESTSRASVLLPILVSDTLPAGVTFVSAADTDAVSPTFDCAEAGGVVTCSRVTDMAVGDAATIEIVVELTANASGSLTNVATVEPQITTDPELDNNTSIVTETIDADADLGAEKTHTGASTPGEPTAFSVVVTNHGPSDAASVTITDTLPDGFTYSGFTNVRGAWSCAVTTAPEFECELLNSSLPLAFTGDAAVDQVEVSIEVDTDADLVGTSTNTVVVSSTTPDSNPDNDDDDADVTFVGVADLALTKSSSGTAVPGGDITWTIEVENLGPSDSQAPITVTDALPTGMTEFTDAEGAVVADGWNCTTTAVLITCVKTSALAAGDTTELTITGTSDPDVTPLLPITNSATVTPTTGEGPNPVGPNTDTDTVDFVEPDVSIVKSVDDLTPQPGDTFSYTIALTNADTTPAHNLVVTDDIPDGIVVDPATIAPAGTLTGTTTIGGDEVGGTITWNIAGPLAAGDTLDLGYDATLAPSSTIDGSAIVNTAALDSYESLATGGRTYTGGDDDATVTPVFPELTIAKEPLGPTPTYIGEEFAWRITVTNNGPGDAGLVSLVDALPENWTFVAGSAVVVAPGPVGATQPTSATAGTPPVVTLTWDDLGPLASGQSLTVSIRTVPTADVADDPGVGRAQPHTNTAEAGAEDPTGATENSTDDYGSDPTTADAFIDAADLVVTKSNAATPAIAGEEYTWTIDVRNDGPDEAIGPFTVTDTLPVLSPEPLVFVSATGTGWSCAESAGIITCGRTDATETLPATAPDNEFEPISVTVEIPSDYLTSIDGPLENTATVDARTFDPDESNNESTIGTSVGGEADLQVVKSRGSTTFIAGEPLTYFLDVTNLGPSTSRADITVVDTLPSSVRFRSAPTAPTTAAEPWDCVLSPAGAPSGGTVTCTLTGTAGGALLADAAAPQIPIEVDVLSNAAPGVAIVNTAVVASTGTVDPVDPNNTSSNSGVPVIQADLAIDKDAQGDLVAGANAVYRMRVVNNGSSDAAAPVRISDDLPAGLTYVGSSDVTGAWTCTPSADQTSFTCDLTGPLAADAEVVVDVEVAVDASVQGTIVNTASVASPTFDPNLDNNTDADTSPFGTIADLSIDKTHVASPVKAGENITWEVVVTNNGPSDSQPDIRVVDPLPASVRFVSAVGAGWACLPAPSPLASYSDVVTCTRDAVLEAQTPGDPGAVNHIAPTITIVAQALPTSGPGPILNGATVLPGPTDDGNPSNNYDDDEVQIIDDVDVSIVKTASPTTVRAGETTTFTIEVANAGPSTADSIVVADTMPSGMTIETLTATGWSCPLSTTVQFRCELAALDPGPAPVITVLARVGAGVPDASVLTNTASVTTSSPDRDLDNNSSDAEVTIVADADLGITKTHPVDIDDPIVAGGTVEFAIGVTNNGPSDAVATVTVEDRLPAGFNYVSVRGPWTCAVRTGTDPDVVDCSSVAGGLAAGASAGTMYMLVQIDAPLDAGRYVNVATVDSPTIDTNPDNDTANDPVDVGTLADLGIVKSHDAGAVRIGENLEFTLQVNNIGPSEARDVVVTDPVPAGLTVVSAAGAADPSTWDCSATVDSDVSCALDGPLAAGADAEPIIVTVLVEPESFPGLDNRAEVTSSTTEPDPDPTPNVAIDPVVVPPLVDLYVTKTHAEPVAVGESIVYTLEVGNLGPIDDVETVTVTDVLPDSLTPLTATSTDADVSCSIDDQTVTCERVGLAVDATFPVEVTAEVLPSAYPLVTNTASVTSPTDDNDPTNNSASDPAVVPPLVDLAIVKTHADPVSVGGQITYTLTVTNNGPTPDPGPVRVLDTLPGSLTPVSATSDDMTCLVTGQNVACQALAPLGVDEVIEVVIVADVGPAASPSVENTATVTTPGCSVVSVSDPSVQAMDAACPDTDLSNNSSTDVAGVAPLVELALVKSLASQSGSTAVWSFEVTNVGPNDTVEPINLLDALPASLSFVSWRGDGWQCAVVLQVVACTYEASVAAGASASPLEIVTTMSGVAAGTEIVNVASVNGGGPDVADVSDDATVIAPKGLPNTGGGLGMMLRWAPVMLLLGVALLLITRRRRHLDVA
ncbi:MAG: hypothetical protein WBP59_12135 [Ilumatobacteraceae bacterium]